MDSGMAFQIKNTQEELYMKTIETCAKHVDIWQEINQTLKNIMILLKYIKKE